MPSSHPKQPPPTRLSLLVGIAALLIALNGCSPAPSGQGDQALKRGDYAEAKAHYEEQLAKNPKNDRVRTALGRALYHLKEYDHAIENLDPVHRNDPGNAAAALYLGLSHEAKDDIPAAEAAYERYLTKDSKSERARQFRGRLLYLRDTEIRKQAKAALQVESTMSIDTTGPPVVAVLPFAVSGPGSDTLSAVGKGLAAAISHDLFQVKSIRVVERLRLHSILEELAMADSGITDRKTAPRVGRLLGARQLVNSGLTFRPDRTVSVQSGVIDATDASFHPAILTEDQLTRLWLIQKDITFAVLNQMGIELTPEERNAIQKIPTRNVEAFLAYSRGIEALNNGDYDAAHIAFGDAARIDPGFEQAKVMQGETGQVLEGSAPAARFESTLAAGLPAATEPSVAGPPPLDMINSVSRPATDPRTDDRPGGGSGSVHVGGTIP